ncbi:LamG-like jellyroll fold domain-containing protein [Jatrophihabitans sp. DSM 45814]
MALPAGLKLELNLTGTWIDVSGDYDGSPITFKFGRSSDVSSTPQAASMSCRFNNGNPNVKGAGAYTPGRQVLADGVTPHPFWPSLTVRKQIRLSYTPVATRIDRFTGYIRQIQPTLGADGYTAESLFSASDRTDKLSKVTLDAPLMTEILQDSPFLFFPLTEPAGSMQALDVASGQTMSVVQSGAGGPLAFGDAGPGSSDGTGVKFAPASLVNGQYLQSGVPPFPKFLPALGDGAEIWVRVLSAPASTTAFFSIEDAGSVGLNGAPAGLSLEVNSAGHVVLDRSGASPVTITSSASIADGGWHLISFTQAVSFGVNNYELFVDTVSQGTATSLYGDEIYRVTVGQSSLSTKSSALFTGNIGYLAWFGIGGAGNNAWNPDRVAARYAAGRGYYGDTSGTRIKRYLAAAGLTSADWDIDPGKAILNTYPQAGKSVVAACQDVVASEGPGAVFYVAPNGKVTFRDRTFRKPGAPILTVDAGADLGVTFAPSLDDLALINQSTGSRSAASGSLSTQTAADDASIEDNELSSEQVTSYATTDSDVLQLLQARVSANANPGYRTPQITIDLLTATTAGLYTALAALQVGSRIRVTSLDATVSPSTQLDLIVEGWTETIAADQYTIVLDTSPADNPATMVLDDTSYGRLQCSGQTLNAAITATASTIVIATSDGPTFTTVPARYPLSTQIGMEVLTLVNPPSGSASPQTFTGVLRGQKGTPAAAQAAGSIVNLWPTATLAL